MSMTLDELSEGQRLETRCAYADLKGALEAQQLQRFDQFDWRGLADTAKSFKQAYFLRLEMNRARGTERLSEQQIEALQAANEWLDALQKAHEIRILAAIDWQGVSRTVDALATAFPGVTQ